MREEVSSFKTMHCPKGANSSFTIGMEGEGGGFGVQCDYIPDQDIFIGYEDESGINCLPFFAKNRVNISESFVKRDPMSNKNKIHCFNGNEIKRKLSLDVDTFEAGKINFEIFTSSKGIPDPEKAPDNILKEELLPAIISRITIDNRCGLSAVRGFFAVSPIKGKQVLSKQHDGKMVGITSISGYGFACVSDGNACEFGEFNLVDMFSRPAPITFELAPIGGICFMVQKGQSYSIDIAMGFYLGDIVTQGLHKYKYYYTKWFGSLHEVIETALALKGEKIAKATSNSNKFDEISINNEKKFFYSQSVRSYYASTMLFRDDKSIRWAVNEGTYMMLNTFDLLVDHLFYELDNHPWAVKNALDFFDKEYSYTDKVHSYEAPKTSYVGGISFTHDHGAYNVFTPKGESSYEITNQDGCFSFMTQEQLCNYVLSLALYFKKTGDIEFLNSKDQLLVDCMVSMENRDHPDETKRDGIMDFDSNKCGIMSEITTYDSLDHSLGQARRSLYLGVKCFATYISLYYLFDILGSKISSNSKINSGSKINSDSEISNNINNNNINNNNRNNNNNYVNDFDERNNILFVEAAKAKKNAIVCAKTIANSFDRQLGFIPAILDGKDKSAIIPAIEGIIYPYFLGIDKDAWYCTEFSEFYEILGKHITKVLQKGLCIFDDNGWKLSANSDNSWISKIFVNQFIAEKIIGLNMVDSDKYDIAHSNWWKVGCPSNPGIDQIFAGKQPLHNFHYPRAISSYLWFM